MSGLIWAMVFSSLAQLLFLLFSYPKFIGSLYIQRTGVRILKNMPFLILFAVLIQTFFQGLSTLLSYMFSEDLSSAFALFTTLITALGGYFILGARFGLTQALECRRFFKSKLKF